MKTKRANLFWGVFFAIILSVSFIWIANTSMSLFHLATGTAAIALALGVAMVTINAKKWLTTHFYLVLALGLIFVSVVDFTQIALFSGSAALLGGAVDQIYQLWQLSSLLLAGSFVLALSYVSKRLRYPYAMSIGYMIVTITGLYLIMTKSIDLKQVDQMGGIGLMLSITIMLLYVVAIFRLLQVKRRFDRLTWDSLIFAIVVLIVAQLVSIISNVDYLLIGSIADIGRFLAYYYLYMGIVAVAINNPETFIFNEISAKQSELSKSNEELKIYKLAMMASSDHMIITDINGKILFANKAAEDITGYTATEMVGKTPAIWGKRMPTEFYEKMWKTIKTDRLPFSGEINNKRKNGDEYTAQIHINPIINDSGELVNFLGMEQDISRQRLVDRMKSEFITVASHQLRTPLSASKWFLEMFTAKDFGEYNEKQAEALTNLTQSNQRMIRIVNGLLNVSRIEGGSLKIVVEEIDFNKTISDVLLEFESTIKANNITVIKDIDPQANMLKTDRKITTEALRILIGNACVYSTNGGNLKVSTKVNDGKFRFTVSDEGLGIPASELDKVFTRFFRASNAIKVITEGSGLGLYFAKELISAMGGEIGFESKVDEGSKFWFELPQDMADKPGFVSLDT